MLDCFNYTDSGCDMTDVGYQFECQSASLQAKGRAGDKQQVGLHRLYEGTMVHDAQLSTWPVKIANIYSFWGDNQERNNLTIHYDCWISYIKQDLSINNALNKTDYYKKHKCMEYQY